MDSILTRGQGQSHRHCYMARGSPLGTRGTVHVWNTVNPPPNTPPPPIHPQRPIRVKMSLKLLRTSPGFVLAFFASKLKRFS
jgi:hypothetical protein